MKKKEKKKITGEMLISDISENFPEVMELIIDEYGMHCFGCHMAMYETLEDGAKVHGIEDEEFTQMLEKLNKLVG